MLPTNPRFLQKIKNQLTLMEKRKLIGLTSLFLIRVFRLSNGGE